MSGITLVALVITIIIIVILATVTINMAFGENGLITEAKFAKDLAANSTTAEGEGMNSLLSEYLNILSEDGGTVTPTPPEEGSVLVTSISISPNSVILEEGQTQQLTAEVSPDNANNREVIWSSENEEIASVDGSTGLVTAKQAGNVTITATAVDGSGVKGTCNVTVQVAGILETTSYVGYYADVDGNGSVDGIIYADLAFSKSGTWNPSGNSSYNSNGTYSYTKRSNLKKYEVDGTYNRDFGSKGIIKPNGGSGNERFYVMALNDVDTKAHCWYQSAYEYGMDEDTSVNFGAGEQNTSKMITKWKASGYGSQNGNSSYPDVWGLSAVQSGTWNGSSGWYVPSRGEWAAFGDNLDITQSNYSNRGLSPWYWSSSQYSTYGAWYANLRCLHGLLQRRP